MVRLNIEDKRYSNFSDYTINLKLNAIASVFKFNALNDILNNVIGFEKCEIFKDNDLLLTGYILVPQYKVTSKPELISISGYSLPGILEDVQIPVSLYPLQSDNLNLQEITRKYLSSFDIDAVFDDTIQTESLKNYKKIIADETQTIKSFLNELASQRGIILTHNEKGNLVFTRINVNTLIPVETFSEGDKGIYSMSLDISGQQLHSEITVIRQASRDNPDSAQSTIQNPYCSIFRPKVTTLSSGDLFDIDKAARRQLSNELTSITLTINTTKFIKPGNLITVTSESLKLNKTEFIIQETEINGDVKDEKYTLKCVLKDVYSNNIVTRKIN